MEKREKLNFSTNAKLGKLVGRELITNNIIAVFELIKNSYDAFANNVYIEFVNFNTTGKDVELNNRNSKNMVISDTSSKIIISDDGQGMTFDEIKTNWMEIGTTSKEGIIEKKAIRGMSTVCRIINGEKGIGRFGCDKLGSKLKMVSVGGGGEEKSHLFIDWNLFDNHSKKLQDIDIECIVKENQMNSKTGLSLEIYGLRDNWTNADILNLKKQLKKMISPFAQEQNDFNIFLKFKNYQEKIINDSFDYARTGINASVTSKGDLKYTIFDESYVHNERLQIREPSFGPAEVRILYLDAAAKRAFAKRNGISVREYGNIKLFRDNFRILPYGELENDWLGIDSKHAQAVFRSLGTRDIIGYVQITKADNPLLKDATNRQGLNEDTFEFNEFKSFIWTILELLQEHIFDKIKTDAEKQGKVIEITVEDIKKDLSSFKKELPKIYDGISLPSKEKDLVIEKTLQSFDAIEKNIEQVEKANKQLSKRLIVMEKIVGTETMLYDLLHAIKNKLDALSAMVDLLGIEAQKKQIQFDIVSSRNIVTEISRMVVAALKRTAPIRRKKENIILAHLLKSFVEEKSLVYPDIIISLENIILYRVVCNVDGLRTVLDNLMNNSIKALKNKDLKKILLSMEVTDGNLKVFFEDNGEGVNDEDIPFIFNVTFTRTGGTGIGLASSLQYMREQGGDISYVKNGNLGGALFVLSFPLK
jgi:nitrogen-specific signal transduction histidine kinase